MLGWLLLGASLLSGAEPAIPNTPKSRQVVFMIGEDEYKTRETLPAFAKTELERRGFRVRIIHADSNDKSSFPGLVAALGEADLLVVSVRRRTPPRAQLDAVRAHLRAGKPLIGIRTASHAFSLRANQPMPAGDAATWPEFDAEVLGGNYSNHHGDGPRTAITLAPEAAEHPVLRGIDVTKLAGNGSLYKVSPLKADAQPLLLGSIPNQPREPIAWTRRYGPNRAPVFYTSLGHPEDFDNPEFRLLLVNAVAWGLNEAAPAGDAR